MKRVKHILTYVLVLSMCFTLFFMPKYTVFADNTYVEYVANTCLTKVRSDSKYNSFVVDYDGRIVVLDFGSNHSASYRYYFAYVADTSSLLRYSWQNSRPISGCNTPSDTSMVAYSYNNHTFRCYTAAFGSLTNMFDDMVIVDASSFNNISTISDISSLAYRYTYGDLSENTPSINYGRVADVEYATRIAGSGLASGDNIDRIVWNQSVDTNGNDLPTGARVQIRAIPGKYVGNTANDVLNKTYTDFVLDHSKQLIIVDIIASRGVYETKWSEVVDHFGFFPYSWVPNIQYLDNEYFKMGWIYQIRLQVDDYYSDWTNIYTATGSGASESQTITDSDEISQQLVQDINIVNQLNNTTTTNWYINETTINNSEYTENTNGKPWWAYLLEAILSLFQIGDGEQQTINNTNNLNINLNDKLNEYNEIEDQQLQNLDTNLDAIEVESDMLENNKFIGSANWVSTQYNRMTNGTVIGSLIGFSLLFGLALIFIGKIR